MIIYEEKTMRAGVYLLIPLLALLLSYPFWNLGDRDLFRDEGATANAVEEMTISAPVVTFHGERTRDLYPLYPLLVKGLHAAGISMEFSVRGVSVLSLIALVMVVWVTCYRTDGLQAAAAGAAMMISTLLIAEKSVEGYPNLLTALTLYLGWMLWFTFGQVRGNWNRAWICAGIFGGLTFYSGGFTGLLYFAVPLAFQRRPLTIWPKLRCWGFLVCVALILGFITLWGVPYLLKGAVLETPEGNSAGLLLLIWEYVEGIFVFPFDFLLHLLPWTLLLWVPFCPALFPLDHNPLFTKFHRILFAVLFLMILFNPETESRDMMYLLPLLATLTGLNYRLGVRRMGARLQSLFFLGGLALLLLAACGGVFFFLPNEILGRLHLAYPLAYRLDFPYFIIGLSECALAFFLALYGMILSRRKGSAVWMTYLILFTSMLLLFWGIVNPYRMQNHSKRELGENMRKTLQMEEHLSDGQLIYKDALIRGFYLESYYLGFPVRSLDLDKGCPVEDETLYVISLRVPSFRNREWTKVYDTSYKEKRMYIWKGVKTEEEEDDYDED